jgi:hypothetical protein
MDEFLGANREFDDKSLSQVLETNSVITIRHPFKPVIIVNNRFTNNIGTFGVINIFNPVFINNPSKPAFIMKSNLFKQNMAYFAGNAFYILVAMYVTKEGIDVT